MKTKTILLLSFLATACGEVTSGDGGDAPTISAVSPERGGLPGGALVTITGTGFVDGVDAELGNRVVIGGREATDVDAVDDATLTFTLPPGPAEGATVDVIVFNSNGFAIASDAITYNPLPLVTAISLSFDGQSGGERVTITGRGFEDFDAGAPTVTIGSAAVTDVTVTSDTELEATIPAHDDGDPFFEELDVVVSNANGTGALPAAFTYLKPGFLAGSSQDQPSLVYIDPDTFDLRPVARTDFRYPGLFLDDDGTLLGLGGFCCSKLLGTIDAQTGAFTALFPNQYDASDLVVSGGRVIVYGRNNNVLTVIDRDTGEATTLQANVGMSEGHAAVAARDATTLFVVSGMDDAIRIVDNTTGAVAVGATMNGPADEFAHAAIELDDLTLLVVGHNRNGRSNLYSVEISTGETTLVKALPTNLTSLSRTPSSFE